MYLRGGFSNGFCPLDRWLSDCFIVGFSDGCFFACFTLDPCVSTIFCGNNTCDRRFDWLDRRFRLDFGFIGFDEHRNISQGDVLLFPGLLEEVFPACVKSLSFSKLNLLEQVVVFRAVEPCFTILELL